MSASKISQNNAQFVQNCFELISGQALHARSLTITHPITGKKMSFEAPIPDDMQAIIDRFKQYMNTMAK